MFCIFSTKASICSLASRLLSSASSIKVEKLSNRVCINTRSWRILFNPSVPAWMSFFLSLLLKKEISFLTWESWEVKSAATPSVSLISFSKISRFFFRPIFLPSNKPTEPPEMLNFRRVIVPLFVKTTPSPLSILKSLKSDESVINTLCKRKLNKRWYSKSTCTKSMAGRAFTKPFVS